LKQRQLLYCKSLLFATKTTHVLQRYCSDVSSYLITTWISSCFTWSVWRLKSWKNSVIKKCSFNNRKFQCNDLYNVTGHTWAIAIWNSHSDTLIILLIESVLFISNFCFSRPARCVLYLNWFDSHLSENHTITRGFIIQPIFIHR
jgi:hypothetical protein